jgi:Zn-dependent protease with chaperone function
VRPALALLGYAAVLAWLLPAVLARLTAHGIAVRAGLAAWLGAMASAAVSGAIALQFVIRAVVAGWPGFSAVVCRSVAGTACTPVVYRNALFELGLGLIATLATVAVVIQAWRYGRRTQQARRRTRVHAEAVRITGRALPGTPAVVLDDARPAAYCVPGRPAVIVLTSAALPVLDPAQLDAVLAHERAHLAGRHHWLVTLTSGLAAAIPAVPLFDRGSAEVARLAEMRADDAAARASGRTALASALLAIGTGGVVPRTALGVASAAVVARLERMLAPARPVRRAGYCLALAALLTLVIILPGALTALAT